MKTAIALLLTATPALAGPIDDALKKVGPAYMCGPTFEYNEALDALRFELMKAGLSERLAGYTIDGVRNAAETNSGKRDNQALHIVGHGDS